MTSQHDLPSVGDIVLFEGHSWDVQAVLTAEPAPRPRDRQPPIQLRLSRRDQEKAPTPYGKPQRYVTRTVFRLAEARRCQLIARQESLF